MTPRIVGIAALVIAAAAPRPAALAATHTTPDDLRTFVLELCDPSLDGRVVGSTGIDRAAEIIAERFAAAGLQPAGDNGTWFQDSTPTAPGIQDAVILPQGAKWGAMRLRNVVGVLPGKGKGCVIVAAHYDHLGRTADGALFPGADDNASGVAALASIAASLAKEEPPAREILFLALSGEETGTLGARHYVEHPLRPLETTIAILNLDTVGRMERRKLFALSTASASEFPSILKGINLGFGLDLAMPSESPFASDHVPFLEKGIPGLHLFTGPNADYHRPGDQPEKLNYEGLVEIADFAAETVRFLAGRDRPLTFVPPGAEKLAPPSEQAARSPRRTSLGTIPDFAYQGEGVLLSGVLPGSPAEQAGLAAGDRILMFDGEAIRTLEDYSAALKSREPGDRVHVGFVRDGASHMVEVVLVERK